MITQISINHNYRAVTIDYKNGESITVTGCAPDMFNRFVDNCMRTMRYVYSRDNGWYQVFHP